MSVTQHVVDGSTKPSDSWSKFSSKVVKVCQKFSVCKSRGLYRGGNSANTEKHSLSQAQLVND